MCYQFVLKLEKNLLYLAGRVSSGRGEFSVLLHFTDSVPRMANGLPHPRRFDPHRSITH